MKQGKRLRVVRMGMNRGLCRKNWLWHKQWFMSPATFFKVRDQGQIYAGSQERMGTND